MHTESFNEFYLTRDERHRYRIRDDGPGDDLDLYRESAARLLAALYELGDEAGEPTHNWRDEHGWALALAAHSVALFVFGDGGDSDFHIIAMTWAEAKRLRVLLEQWLKDDDGAPAAPQNTEQATPAPRETDQAAPVLLSRVVQDAWYAWEVWIFAGGGARLQTYALDGNKESIDLAVSNAAQLADALRALANKDQVALEAPTLDWRVVRQGDLITIAKLGASRHYSMTPTCAALIALAISELRAQLPQDQAVRISGLRPGTVKLWRDEREEADAARWQQLRRYANAAEVDGIMARCIGRIANGEELATAVDMAADAHMRGVHAWTITDGNAPGHNAPFLKRVTLHGVEISITGADGERHQQLLEQIRDLLNGDE